MKLGKKQFSAILKFIRSPYLALFVTIFLGVGAFVYIPHNKEPSYNITSPITVLDNQNLDSDFKFFWKETELNNISQIDLTIWNDGDEFIDYSDFVKSSPIKLQCVGKVNIHNVRIIERSRSEIAVSTKIIENDSMQYILFYLKGEEALEYLDGFKAKITYSTQEEIDWLLEGRVKGAKNGYGFEEIPLTKESSSPVSIYVSIFLFLIVIIRIIVSYKKEKAIIFKGWEIVFIICYLMITYFIPLIFDNIRDFNWL
ncbi:MAG: hypothetical protein ACEPOZ_05915 [Marinifilaceae bacterium]